MPRISEGEAIPAHWSASLHSAAPIKR